MVDSIKLEEFVAGTERQQYKYRSFHPNKVNVEWRWGNPGINTRLEEASRALAELNAFSMIVPDIDLFIEMHVMKEANQSSRIEGTRTDIDEAVMDVTQVAPEKRDDWHEVRNYVTALNDALSQLDSVPLSVRILRSAHEKLMQGVRGENKMPGEFRTSQNWIGGTNLNNAVFIPPHHSDVADLMSDLEQFWHNEEIMIPDLIRIAISHYQFETIHPFLDGNGRIGRLLITLYLVSKGVLEKPSLYLSDFFERNRGAYYDALTRVRSSNDMVHWVIFFLDAVIETAQGSRDTLREILSLRDELEGQIVTLGRRSKNGRTLLRHLFRNPVVTVKDVAATLDVTARVADQLVKKFVEMGILEEVSGLRRFRVFAFRRFLGLFR